MENRTPPLVTLAAPALAIILTGTMATLGAQIWKTLTRDGEDEHTLGGVTPLAPLERDLTNLNVPFVSPGDASWNEAITPFNMRPALITPRIVIQATTILHVQNAVRCAVKHGLKVSAKSGGHSYANYGLGGKDGHMVIQLDRMYGVQLHEDNTATIQAGSRLGHVATELYMQGKRAISHGTCPGVGLAGHALHGGYGFSSHKYGLALDWVTGCKVVLADGQLMYTSKEQNGDLFWAMRGAGSSFGIVVEFDVDTFEVPRELCWIKAKMGIGRDRDVALQGLKAWQEYVERGVPTDMLVRLSISEDPGAGPFLEAMYYGTEEEAMRILAPLTKPLELDWDAEVTYVEMGDWPEHLVALSERTDNRVNLTNSYETDHHYASSLVTRHILDEGLEAFVDYWFTTGKADQDKKWWIQMDVHGGKHSAISKVPNAATAYPHRDKTWLFQFFCRTHEQPDVTKTYNLLNGFMDSIKNSMKKGDWGRYANYVDSELGRKEALKQYYGDNLPMLRKIKARWDPTDVFHFPQSVTRDKNCLEGVTGRK